MNTKLTNKLKNNGVSNGEVKLRAALKKLTGIVNSSTLNKLKDGDKVTLNIESIKSDVNYQRKVPDYKQFVEDNKDTVFTVEYDKKHTKESLLICFKEDNRKWLWHELDIVRVEVK